MSLPQWTLQPWLVEDNGRGQIEVFGTENHPTRQRVLVGGFELAEDAALCCSASPLYEALKALVAAADKRGWNPDSYPLVRARLEMAKARGEEVKP